MAALATLLAALLPALLAALLPAFSWLLLLLAGLLLAAAALLLAALLLTALLLTALALVRICHQVFSFGRIHAFGTIPAGLKHRLRR